MPVCPVCLKECIEIKDDMAIHRYIGEWVANMCVISPRTIASQQSFAPDAFCECPPETRTSNVNPRICPVCEKPRR